MILRFSSYNFHKGRTILGGKFNLMTLKKFLDEENIDIGLFQEVLGHHQYNLEIAHQVEQLADKTWPLYSFAKNSIVNKFDHGNAILSKYPIVKEKILNISLNKLEKRSAILLSIEFGSNKIYCLNTHLNLREKDRIIQAKMILNFININTDRDVPIVIGGDFNDWTGIITKYFETDGGFSTLHPAKVQATFPSFYPVVALDRVLCKNALIINASVGQVRKYNFFSDHLPIFYNIKI